jgi:hypothetical protein
MNADAMKADQVDTVVNSLNGELDCKGKEQGGPESNYTLKLVSIFPWHTDCW